MTLFFSTCLVAAEAQTDTLVDALLGFLPIVLFLGILYFLFRRQVNSPAAKLQREEKERHLKHMQKMEELAERIAKALERNQ
jgi:ATP-dependent Zn protease